MIYTIEEYSKNKLTTDDTKVIFVTDSKERAFEEFHTLEKLCDEENSIWAYRLNEWDSEESYTTLEIHINPRILSSV